MEANLDSQSAAERGQRMSDWDQWKTEFGKCNGKVFLGFISVFCLFLLLAGGIFSLLGMSVALYMMYTLFNYVKSRLNSDVTLGALIRYFNWACVLLVVYLIGMIHWAFLGCWGAVLLISLYFLCSAKDWHDGWLKFFFIYPLDPPSGGPMIRRDTWNTSDSLGQYEWFLWRIRMFFAALGLGSLAQVLGGVHVKPPEAEHAIGAFLAAGFCEEFYKMMFTGTVSALALYSQSPEAIRQLSIGSASGFTLMEDVLYALDSGLITLITRLLFFPLHICFNQICALGVARQRAGCTSAFEILIFFFLAVIFHGLYDYCLFLSKPEWIFAISLFIVAPCTCFLGWKAWDSELPEHTAEIQETYQALDSGLDDSQMTQPSNV